METEEEEGDREMKRAEERIIVGGKYGNGAEHHLCFHHTLWTVISYGHV